MICPRCTHALPEDSRYCPACGLDLRVVETPVNAPAAADAGPAGDAPAAPETADAGGVDGGGLWQGPLRLQDSMSPKRPLLAATLAFFFGPFAYLYLEQSGWFWWGLLGGLLLIVVTRAELLLLLVLGFTVHAYDVAGILNRRFQARGGASGPAVRS